MTRRAPVRLIALLGNGMAWFGSSVFVLALAGERLDGLTSGSPLPVVGFVLLLAVGSGLLLGGVLDNRRIRTSRSSDP